MSTENRSENDGRDAAVGARRRRRRAGEIDRDPVAAAERRPSGADLRPHASADEWVRAHQEPAVEAEGGPGASHAPYLLLDAEQAADVARGLILLIEDRFTADADPELVARAEYALRYVASWGRVR